jgi:hypothetical protein
MGRRKASLFAGNYDILILSGCRIIDKNIADVYYINSGRSAKGSMDTMQPRLIEESKIHCARGHFKAISNGIIEM